MVNQRSAAGGEGEGPREGEARPGWVEQLPRRRRFAQALLVSAKKGGGATVAHPALLAPQAEMATIYAYRKYELLLNI